MTGSAARAQTETPFQADPERPWVEAADRMLAEGKLEAAARAYRELTGAHARDAQLWLRIAFVELQLERTGSALEAARTANEIAPDDLDTIVMLAQAQAFAGDPDLGIGILRRGLERFPRTVPLLEAMATLSVGLERYADAAGMLRELIRLEPGQAGYHIDLGRILLTAGEADDAISAFERAREMGADAAECVALIGKGHLAAGRSVAARSAFEESVDLRPNADALGGLGTLEYLAGDRDRAISSFRRALELDPLDADLHFNLGNLLAQSEDLEGAERAFRASLRLDPGSAITHLNLGVLLLNRFAVVEAEQHLRRAQRLDPAMPGPYLHLARIAGALFRHADAIASYRRYRERVEDAAEKRRIDGVVAKIEQRAAQSRQALDRGEVHLLQLVVGTQARAAELAERARAGEDFFVLARRNSEVADLAGVDAGFVHPDHLDPGLRAVVAGLVLGEVSSPVQTAAGWCVFKRVE